MLSVDDLWRLIDQTVPALPAQMVSLSEAHGRRLAEAVTTDEDLPAFTRSAIDGFLVSADARPGLFRIVGEIKPGVAALSTPTKDDAIRICTGSALPSGGIGLVMVEDTEPGEGGSVVIKVAPSRAHIREQGSQMKAGQIVIESGVTLGAGAIALLASIGKTRVLVSPKIRVAHLVTGSEIVPADRVPGPGCVRDANTPLVAALLQETGAERVFSGHSNEEVDSSVACLADVDADVILISGGASVGTFDGTADVLRRLGFTIHSERVKSRPGKPLIFATRNSQVAFGLPGNPLSHFVCFHLFVQRALARLAGSSGPSIASAELARTSPPPDNRETWWPAHVSVADSRLLASPLPWRDSSDLSGLPSANALLRVHPSGANKLVEALIFGKVGA